jgi:DnaJ-domain-containing protein 1
MLSPSFTVDRTYHPDLQANASQAEKDRAIERSKLITDAYRKLKSNA